MGKYETYYYGKELVDAGVISKEWAKKNLNKYLPPTYTGAMSNEEKVNHYEWLVNSLLVEGKMKNKEAIKFWMLKAIYYRMKIIKNKHC